VKRESAFYLLYVTLAVALGFADVRMRAHTDNVIKSYIPGVVTGTESAPGVYRVLAPFTIDGIARATGASLLAVWYVTRLVFFYTALCVMHVYLRTWFPPGEAFAGVAFTAATFPLTFTNSWPHPDHVPELALFTLGAWAIARRRDASFAVALALAAFNRETSVFLVLLYFVAGPLTISRFARTGLFGMEWFAIYAGLRWARGLHHYEYWQFSRNVADLGLLPAPFDPYYRAYAYFGIALFGPLIYLAVCSQAAPSFARRALLVVPIFVAVCFTFSNIIESRIFTPLYPLVLPAVLSALYASRRVDTPASVL
jgi:hypothetical protein